MCWSIRVPARQIRLAIPKQVAEAAKRAWHGGVDGCVVVAHG